MNLYIGNLPFKMKEEELRNLFSEFGTVKSVKVIVDKETKRSKGYGFVEMETADAGSAAIQGLNGKDVMGRPLTVNEAKPREARA